MALSMTRWLRLACIAFCLASLAGAQGAFAQAAAAGNAAPVSVPAVGSEPAPPPSANPETDLHFALAPYLWAPGMSGDVSVRGRSASFNASFIDVIEESDSILGFMGNLEVDYGRVIGYLDGTWFNIGASRQTSNLGQASLSMNMGIFEFALGYRIASWGPNANGPDLSRVAAGNAAAADAPTISIDGFLGGRMTTVGTDLSINAVGNFSEDHTWVSPFVGGRVVADLSKDWTVMAGASIGGFGAGSELEWSAIIALEWKFKIGELDSGLIGGYKALGYDVQRGRRDQFSIDAVFHGLIFGMIFRF